jgi:DNA-binding CsgD family transcriptional regulator
MSGYHQHRDIDLSAREREVLELMAKGLTNGQIAGRLDIAFDTAKSHVSAVISKLGVDTREEAVRAWGQRQRLGSRVSRMARGLVTGVGMWKVAAGTAVSGTVVAGTAAVAIGVLGDGSAPVIALDVEAPATATATPWADQLLPGEIYIASIVGGGHATVLSMAKLPSDSDYGDAGEYLLSVREQPSGGLIVNLGAEPGHLPVFSTWLSCPSAAYGATMHLDAESVELIRDGKPPIEAPLVDVPSALGLPLEDLDRISRFSGRRHIEVPG